ncbi:fibronectin type III domain-containing protein [Verrucomicrobium sp. BvORR106]|uniref:fibronectin type III domain-containing protein n=1 Tax=Verrucomicrobium sp. BvORR106 TaxID=1403819 RepID=UPI0009DD0783|nr:fibronectin type III domain-containing protein [Verrucomicrobium sp. BvORR106]
MMGIDRWRWMVGMWSAIWTLIALTGGLRAVEVIQGPDAVIDASGTKATLTWQTDAECGTRVRYGLAPDKLEWKAGDGVAVQHSAILEGLAPGTTYYYTVGTAKVRLKSGQFTLPAKGATPEGPVLKKKPPTESAAAPRAPPARVTWGHLPSLRDHFERHGSDFAAKNEEDYARQAWEFLQRAMTEGLPAKQDASDGTLRVYDPASGAFAAYNRDGTTKTYFKPGSSGYWDRQPGRPVRLRKP